MSKPPIECVNDFLNDSDKLFHDEITTDENKDYRRGFYAGRLFAALSIKNFLNQHNSQIDLSGIRIECD